MLPPKARTNIESAYLAALSILPLKARIAVQYFKSFRTFPNFTHPKTFNEKCQRFKLIPDPRIPDCVNKITAKHIALDRLGPAHITSTLYSGDFLPPIEQRNWPIPYVIKTNHGSGLNIFIRSKSDEEWSRIDPLLRSWLQLQFGYLGGELYYSEMKPQVLVEPFISRDGNLPVDYKIFVFDGVPRFIQIDTDRERDHKRIIFDTDWNRQSFRFGYPMDHREFPKPPELPELLDCAAKLAKGHAFMRADFYVVDGRVIFGEMGFTPDSGFNKFFPSEWDRKFGDMWPD